MNVRMKKRVGDEHFIAVAHEHNCTGNNEQILNQHDALSIFTSPSVIGSNRNSEGDQ